LDPLLREREDEKGGRKGVGKRKERKGTERERKRGTKKWRQERAGIIFISYYFSPRCNTA